MAILLLAAGLRLFMIDRHGLWLDELWTLSLTAGRGFDAGVPADELILHAPPRATGLADAVPWWRIWTHLGETVTHPPLYFTLLRLWREAFGEGDLAARMLSVIFSLIAIGLIYDVGRLIFDRATGLWSAALMAVAAPQLLLAVEARNYTIQLAFALAAAGALVRVERFGATWPRLIALAAALLALVLSHYFAIGAALAIGLYALLRLRGPARWKALAAIAASAVLFLVIWGPSMWQQRQVFAVGEAMNAWLYDTSPGRPLRAVWDALLVPARLLGGAGLAPLPLALIGAAVIVLPLALLRRRPAILLPSLWLLCTAGVLLALDVFRSSLHLQHDRYVLLAGPGVYLLISDLLHAGQRWRHALPAAAVALCLLFLPPAVEEADRFAEDWRGAAEYIARESQPGDVILLSSASAVGYFPNIAYLGLSHYLGQLPGPFVIAQEPPPPELITQLNARLHGQTAWLVTVPDERLDPTAIWPGVEFHEIGSFPPAVMVWRGKLAEPDHGAEPGPEVR